jgi:hypothetical protein
MRNEHVVDKRKVKLEDFKHGQFIPFLKGRPSRATVIGQDDIANLLIALNTSKDFDSFLKSM